MTYSGLYIQTEKQNLKVVMLNSEIKPLTSNEMCVFFMIRVLNPVLIWYMLQLIIIKNTLNLFNTGMCSACTIRWTSYSTLIFKKNFKMKEIVIFLFKAMICLKLLMLIHVAIASSLPFRNETNHKNIHLCWTLKELAWRKWQLRSVFRSSC